MGQSRRALRPDYTLFMYSRGDLSSSKPLLPCRSHGTLCRTCMCASRQGNYLGSCSIRLAFPRGSYALSKVEFPQVE